MFSYFRLNHSYGRGSSVEVALVWLCALVLQACATIAAWDRFTYEEVGGSIRDPFWLDNHSIFDGASCNIGWYALCLAAYKVLGFSLAAGKLVRLALHAVSWACLLGILRRVLPGRRYILPAFAVALSPAALYFTTYQAEFALDIQFAPIVLWCLLSVPVNRCPMALALYAASGAIAMLAAMSYPSALIYFPFAAIFAAANCWRSGGSCRKSVKYMFPMFAAPAAGAVVLLAGAMALEQPGRLFFDPHNKTGLFRSGGGQASWKFDSILKGVRLTLEDLFVSGRSYYFSLKEVEFAGWLGHTACAVLIALALVIAIRKSNLRFGVLLSLAMLVGGLFLPNLSAQYPGLRRCTIVLFAAYALCVLSCVYGTRYLESPRTVLGSWLRHVFFVPCALLVVHHAMSYPGVIRELLRQNGWRESWMSSEATPDEALQKWAAKVKNGEQIECGSDSPGKLPKCRFSEFYAAVAGYEKWSRGRDAKVRVMAPKKGPVLLSTRLWDNYYFEH